MSVTKNTHIFHEFIALGIQKKTIHTAFQRLVGGLLLIASPNDFYMQPLQGCEDRETGSLY